MGRDPRRLRTYGRRKGHRLSARKTRLLDELLPKLRLDLEAPPPAPLASLFPGSHSQVWLEIGFGAGEHLVWQAQANPHIGFIGCEPFINGVATLLGEIDARKLANILIHDGDAREVLDWLADASLARIFLLYPDPWPKARHHKRRLIRDATLDRLAEVMKDGVELRLATDDMDYLSWMLERLIRHPAFEWLARGPRDWRERPADWPPTRYEIKALDRGRRPVYLRFRRRPRRR